MSRTKATKPKAKTAAKGTGQKRAMGRPSGFTEARADYILAQMVDHGRPLVDVCGDDGMPSRSSVYRWLADDPQFAERVRRAHEAIGDHAAWKARQTADGCKPETANADRVKILAYQWEASRMAPSKFSERRIAELVGKDGGPIRTENTNHVATLDASQMDPEDRERLRTILRAAKEQMESDERPEVEQ